MVKMSASFVKGTATSIKHNNRDFKEKDWETKYHNHINREREKDNKYLQSTPIREKYDELFGEEVERYNATQKRKDRKIDDYFNLFFCCFLFICKKTKCIWDYWTDGRV